MVKSYNWFIANLENDKKRNFAFSKKFDHKRNTFGSSENDYLKKFILPRPNLDNAKSLRNYEPKKNRQDSSKHEENKIDRRQNKQSQESDGPSAS
jgi:hypothetical protein